MDQFEPQFQEEEDSLLNEGGANIQKASNQAAQKQKEQQQIAEKQKQQVLQKKDASIYQAQASADKIKRDAEKQAQDQLKNAQNQAQETIKKAQKQANQIKKKAMKEAKEIAQRETKHVLDQAGCGELLGQILSPFRILILVATYLYVGLTLEIMELVTIIEGRYWNKIYPIVYGCLLIGFLISLILITLFFLAGCTKNSRHLLPPAFLIATITCILIIAWTWTYIYAFDGARDTIKTRPQANMGGFNFNPDDSYSEQSKQSYCLYHSIKPAVEGVIFLFLYVYMYCWAKSDYQKEEEKSESSSSDSDDA